MNSLKRHPQHPEARYIFMLLLLFIVIIIILRAMLIRNTSKMPTEKKEFWKTNSGIFEAKKKSIYL